MSRKTRRRAELVEALVREGRRSGAVSTLQNHACADVAGVHPTDWEGLDVLDWTGPITAGELARHTGLTSGAVTGLVDRLERGGFARRVRDTADRRRVIVEMVHDSLPQLGELFGPLISELDRIHDRFTEDELAVILDYMRSVNDAITESTDRMREAALAAKAPR